MASPSLDTTSTSFKTRSEHTSSRSTLHLWAWTFSWQPGCINTGDTKHPLCCRTAGRTNRRNRDALRSANAKKLQSLSMLRIRTLHRSEKRTRRQRQLRKSLKRNKRAKKKRRRKPPPLLPVLLPAAEQLRRKLACGRTHQIDPWRISSSA